MSRSKTTLWSNLELMKAAPCRHDMRSQGHDMWSVCGDALITSCPILPASPGVADTYVIKPCNVVPVFSYTQTLAGLKFSTVASVFTSEAEWSCLDI